MEAEEKKPQTEHHKEMPTVGELFQESWIAFRKSLLNIFLLHLMYYAVIFGIVIISVILFFVLGVGAAMTTKGDANSFDPSMMLPLFIGGGIYILIVCTVLLVAAALMHIGSILAIDQYKERISVGELLRKSWVLLIPAFIAGAYSFVIIFGGYFVLLIPGVLFSWYLTFVTNEVVLGHERGINALRASAYTVMKNFWEIALRILPLIGVYFVLNIITSIVPMIASIIDEDLGAVVNIVTSLLMFIPSIMLQWYFMVYGVMLYRHAKKRTGEKKYANIVWMWVVSGIGWVIAALLITLFINFVASGAFDKMYNEDNRRRADYYFNNNTQTQSEYEDYSSDEVPAARETFDAVNTYREENGLPTLQEDPMLCAYAQRRLTQLMNGYDNAKGFYEDRANPTIVGSYFKDFIKVGEAYYDLSIPATAEDVVYFWAEDGNERTTINMKNYDAGCVRANYDSMILIVGESK